VGDHSWWVASKELQAAHALESPEEGSRAFPEGGYYVSRMGDPARPDVLVWDCGPFGYSANRKHAHADALSVVLAVRGVTMLYDPGVGGFRDIAPGQESSPIADLVREWRRLRTTRAHNTVRVDGEDQGIMADRYEIWDPPEPRTLLWSTAVDFDVMWGRHLGYARLADPVTHDRLIIASRHGYWIVLDLLSGQGIHSVETRYNFAPGSELRRGPSGARFIAEREGVRLELALFGPENFTSQIDLGDDVLLGELKDGEPERIRSVSGFCRASLPIAFGIVLTDPSRNITLRMCQPQIPHYRLELDLNDHIDRVLVRLGALSTADGRRGPTSPIVVIERFARDGKLVGAWQTGGDRGAGRGLDPTLIGNGGLAVSGRASGRTEE
ncbi:MAG: heparinase II/III family protein, partial [Gemmatimonadota bacterium]